VGGSETLKDLRPLRACSGFKEPGAWGITLEYTCVRCITSLATSRPDPPMIRLS